MARHKATNSSVLEVGIEPWESFANAIITKAVEDYRGALKQLAEFPKDISAGLMKTQCEQFFRSERYRVLTTVDGEYLMKRIKEENNG